MKDHDKTKLMIVKALEEQLRTKPIERISISEIMRNCNMTRQTFYKHFIDIYDLIFWFHKYNTKDSLAAFSKNKDIKECFILTLTKMTKHKDFYKNAITLKGPNSFKNCYYNLQMNYAKEHIGYKKLDVNLLLQLQLFWHGVTCLQIDWVLDDMKISPEIMAENVYRSLPTDLKKYYE